MHIRLLFYRMYAEWPDDYSFRDHHHPATPGMFLLALSEREEGGDREREKHQWGKRIPAPPGTSPTASTGISRKSQAWARRGCLASGPPLAVSTPSCTGRRSWLLAIDLDAESPPAANDRSAAMATPPAGTGPAPLTSRTRVSVGRLPGAPGAEQATPSAWETPSRPFPPQPSGGVWVLLADLPSWLSAPAAQAPLCARPPRVTGPRPRDAR